MQETVLLLEDDATLLWATRGMLELKGYRVLACADMAAARAAVWEETPDLMILDVMLPDGSGVAFCREYRDACDGGTPVLFLTALGTQKDMLAGYGAGGTDYLVKPFNMDILLLKVRALLDSRKAGRESIVVGPLRLDCRSKTAYVDGEDLLLTPKEFSVLEYLARGRSRYSTAKEIYEAVWGKKAYGEDTVKHHIREIRRKIGEEKAIDIASKWGEGYRLTRSEPMGG